VNSRNPNRLQSAVRLFLLPVIFPLIFYCLSCRTLPQPRAITIHLTEWAWSSWGAPYATIRTYCMDIREGEYFGPIEPGITPSGKRAFQLGQIVDDTTIRVYLDNSLTFIRDGDIQDESVHDSILVSTADLRFRTPTLDSGHDYLIRIDTSFVFENPREIDSLPRKVEVTDLDNPRSWQWTESKTYPGGNPRTITGFVFDDEWKPVRHGAMQTYSPEGQLTSEIHFVYGCNDGAYGEWYENGGKKVAGLYICGPDHKLRLRHGDWKYWDENGRPCGVGAYDHGTGTSRLWYADDSPRSVEFYTAGRPDSVWQEWYENGQLKLVTDFRNGNARGSAILYSPDGAIERQVESASLLAYAPRDWYDNGQIRKDNRKDVYLEWYPDGRKKIEYEKQAFPTASGSMYRAQGHQVEWFPDGQVHLEGQNEDGHPVGTWTEFNEQGAVVAAMEWLGPREYDKTIFYLNGNKRSRGHCVGTYPYDAVRNGLWEYWDEDGTMNRTEQWVSGIVTHINDQRYIP